MNRPLAQVRRALLLAVIAGCGTAAARIGETVEQCVERYGKPVKSLQGDGKAIRLKSAHWETVVTIRDGKATMIAFDRLENSKFVEITDEEIEAIKSANGEGKGWTLILDLPNSRIWRRSDRQAVAVLDVKHRRLTLATRAEAEARKIIATGDAENTTRGF